MEWPSRQKATNLNWAEDFWTLTDYFAYGIHVLFCVKTQSSLIATGQTDSNWAEEVLILLLGANPGCSSRAVFRLLYHTVITSYNKLWQSLSRAVPPELSQLLEGSHWSVCEKGELSPGAAGDRNWALLNCQKSQAMKPWSHARHQHCLFWDTTDRARALKFNICVAFRYSNCAELVPQSVASSDCTWQTWGAHSDKACSQKSWEETVLPCAGENKQVQAGQICSAAWSYLCHIPVNQRGWQWQPLAVGSSAWEWKLRSPFVLSSVLPWWHSSSRLRQGDTGWQAGAQPQHQKESSS